MKVAWVQDISRPHGGAENSNRTVVAAGEKRGHDIVGLTPRNFYPWILEQADVVIINNLWEFENPMLDCVMRAIRPGGKRYVVYSHDHRDAYRRPDFARKLFGGSALNVFISPRHMGNYRKALGCNGIALPLAIDADLFRPAPVVREEKAALVVGGWVRGGKISKLLRSFMEDEGKALGYRFLSVGFALNGAEVIPHRPLARMPEVYSRAHALVHYPDIECAGERIVFEAALCGVERFHLGDRVGHKSWGFDLADRESLAATLRRAPVQFWEEVERIAES